MTLTLQDVDLDNPDHFVAGTPHDAFRLLRREAPVHFNRERTGAGFWVLSKYTDIREASKRPDLYSSALGGTNIMDLPPEDLQLVQMMLINMDPPEHRWFRNIVKAAFLPRAIGHLRESIAELASEIVDEVIEKGECDFVEDVACKMPTRVICEMVGVPREDWDAVYELSNKLVGFDDPAMQAAPEEGKKAAFEMFIYASRLAQKARKNPGDDVASRLLTAEVDGHKLTDMQFNCFFLMLMIAGNETTRTVTTNGMLALMRHPEQWRMVLDDMSLLPGAVEEMCRFDPPVHHFRRTATQDIELRGQTIKKGDKVTFWYPSANRDEEIFDAPDTFDITRSPNDHIAFGAGEHFCLGAHLARLELNVVFEEILTRMKDVQLAGQPRRLRSNFINGVMSMPVTFRPSHRTGSKRAA